MADEKDDSTKGEINPFRAAALRHYLGPPIAPHPLSVAIEGVSDGAEYEGEAATPERARALGAFVESLFGESTRTVAARHLTPHLTDELVDVGRTLVLALHRAAQGDRKALSDIRAGAAGMRNNRVEGGFDVQERRASLVCLVERLRETKGRRQFDQVFVGELVGIDPRVIGRGTEALDLLPQLLDERLTPTRAAAKLSRSLNIFGDGERSEKRAKTLFEAATKRT